MRAFAVDDAGEENFRADAVAAVEDVMHGGDEGELVADVADGGDAGGEVDGSPLDLLVVGVHVPEAGDEEFSGGV